MSKYIKLEDAIDAVTSIFRVSALFSGMNDNENEWREKAEKVLAKCEVVTDTAKQGIEHIEVSEDCISREWVRENMLKYGFIASDMTITEFVEDAPSVKPIRAIGKWVAIDDTHDKCTECGAIFCITSSDEWEVNYCPNCGARMESDT